MGMKNLAGTTSSHFSVGSLTLFSDSSDDSSALFGDVRIRNGSWQQFSVHGWLDVEALGKVTQTVESGYPTAISEFSDLVVVDGNLGVPTVLTLPSGRKGQTIVVKDQSGTAGRFHITVGAYAIDSNYGSIELLFTDSWIMVAKVSSIITSDSTKKKIDLESFTIDQDFI